MTAHFHKPTSVADALSLLAGDEGALCLAGGATLVAMMNARLAEPTALVGRTMTVEPLRLTLPQCAPASVSAARISRMENSVAAVPSWT